MKTTLSNQSKYAFDGSKSINTLNSDVYRQGNAYDALAQKSIVKMSINNNQSVQDMLSENPQLEGLVF